MKKVSSMVELFADIQNYQGLVDDEIEDLIKKVNHEKFHNHQRLEDQ